MLNIWLLERGDSRAFDSAISALSKELVDSGKVKGPIKWHTFSPLRIWQECIALSKHPESEKLYPDIIEYPLAWHDSLAFIGLLAKKQDLNRVREEQWLAIKDSAYKDSFCVSFSDSLLSFPWLVGFLSMFYRKDMLRIIGKTHEDLTQYSSWKQTLQSIPTTMTAFEMDFTFFDAMWWIWNFGGDFIDPINYMPAFLQAEALQGITAMLETAVNIKTNAVTISQFSSLLNPRNTLGGFPDSAFSKLSFDMPPAFMKGNPKVTVALAPYVKNHVTATKEYALGISNRCIDTNIDEAISFISAIARDEASWLKISMSSGFLPYKLSLWDEYLEHISDPLAREVYFSARTSARRMGSMPFMAPFNMIFEDSLEDCLLTAKEHGKVDPLRVSTALAKIASEYRLMTALHQDSIAAGMK
ncbi:hypothetical protein ACFL6Y_09495 [Elusimicrobiota bacterium]